MIDATPLQVGQIWEAKGTHAGLRVMVKKAGASVKVQTLKNSRGVTRGRGKLLDKPWHIPTDVLRMRYMLVRNVDPEPTTTGEEQMVMTLDRPSTLEDEKRTTAHSTPEYKAAQRESWDRRFAELSDKDKRDILELRGNVAIGDLLRDFKINKPVLGMVVRWGVQQSLSDQPDLTEQAPQQFAEVVDEIAGAMDVADKPSVSETQYVEIFGVQTPIGEAPQSTEMAESNVRLDPNFGTTSNPQQRYRVRMMVYQPVEVEREISGDGFADVELRCAIQIGNKLHEIISIEKVR